jgi:3alpha(or 20beta)-hydroxysteroid dehydrogenase
MNPIAVSDLKIIVTGGARGIGAATVRLLAQGGAKVLITDVLEGDMKVLSAETGAPWRHLDVASEAQWQAAVAQAEGEFGGLNALFNNAGILAFGGVKECTAEQYRKVIDINLTGAFLGIRICAPAIARSGGGAIVNTSSTAGLQGYGGLAAYVSSKWGLRGLTKAAALDLAHDKVRVVSLHPGPIRTPMTDGMGDEIAGAQPIPRFGEAEEVARMVRFLFTEATYSTGSEFTVDGGAVTGQVLQLPQG